MIRTLARTIIVLFAARARIPAGSYAAKVKRVKLTPTGLTVTLSLTRK